MNADAIEFRSCQAGDEGEIMELFHISYEGREMLRSGWNWRFQDNPFGSGVIELGWDGTVLAAHYAVTALPLSIGGQTCLGGLSGTTMTHPSYRRQGIFPMMARRAYLEMANRGMAVVWGFPNVKSHRNFVCDLGWRDIYEIPMLRLHIVPGKFTPAISESHLHELSDADERFDRFWERVRSDYENIVCRDRSYVRWRYFSHPLEKYWVIAHIEKEEIKGYAVFKRFQDELQVVDLLIAENEVEIGENLINFVISQAVAANAGSVSLWLNVVHPLHHSLERVGFRPEGPVTYFGAMGLSPGLNGSLYDFRRWHFAMGDSDVF